MNLLLHHHLVLLILVLCQYYLLLLLLLLLNTTTTTAVRFDTRQAAVMLPSSTLGSSVGAERGKRLSLGRSPGEGA